MIGQKTLLITTIDRLSLLLIFNFGHLHVSCFSRPFDS
jgi:hypothetical protein